MRVAVIKRNCEDGLLAFAGRSLVAVLVRLTEEHGEDAGKWFMEAGFGRVAQPAAGTFADLDEAQTWIAERLRPPHVP